ncbi:MAG: peptide/nickel transport system permease protein [Solirubrobacteraceae bacterium]|jgi:peptide/nickel transport system permease protein|nr:peptide/nickel transport system permease protein [Solirubrobacteraceae bacterium]
MSSDAPDVLVVVEQDAEFIDEGGERTIVARSPTQLFVMRFRRDKVAMTALGFIVLLLLIAILAPLIVKALGVQGPKAQNPDALDAFGTATGPSAQHPFGVDQLGRDLVSRTIYGSRVSLEAAVLGTGLAALIGTTVGLVAGFFGGFVDTMLSRTTDLVLAFPILLLGLGLAAACSGADGCVGGLVQPGLGVVILVISLFTWPYIARIVRGQTLSLREKEFVEAARSLGASNRRIIARDILPNLVAPLIVYTSLLIPVNILLEASLSFLGVGVQGGTPSWGAMIAEASGQFPDSWWYMLFPGLALLLTVLAFNLVGDGLQDALNPRGRK